MTCPQTKWFGCDPAQVGASKPRDGYNIVDFGEVRRLLGLKEVRLASERELLALFPDCELGAMPPFGNLF
jgi:hypothetical protein